MTGHRPAAEERPGTARERLLAAAVQVLLKRGYRGATSREIARLAQVNEVTLFRLFSTKDDLLATAVAHRAEVDRALAPTPTGDLETDLIHAAEAVVRALAEGEHLVLRLMPEITRLPAKQRAAVGDALSGNQEAFLALFRHYQEQGELAAGPTVQLWRVFVGPILMAVHDTELREHPLEFDVHRHVQLFLHGSGARRDP